jgi:hypothetical protein
MVGGTCYLRKIDQTWNDGRILVDMIPFIAQMVIQVTENAPCGPIHIYTRTKKHMKTWISCGGREESRLHLYAQQARASNSQARRYSRKGENRYEGRKPVLMFFESVKTHTTQMRSQLFPNKTWTLFIQVRSKQTVLYAVYFIRSPFPWLPTMMWLWSCLCLHKHAANRGMHERQWGQCQVPQHKTCKCCLTTAAKNESSK